MLQKKIHMVGIGGAGMSAIAHYLLDQNVQVSGSDIEDSQVLTTLSERGCEIYKKHETGNITGADLVVCSDAIPLMNLEVAAATKAGISVTKRARFLQSLGVGKTVINVSGSHGKTTTAAMIATVLMDAGLDPDFILGADLPGFDNKRARASGGRFMVAEACEAFRNLPCYTSGYAVISNIDDEHLEHYGDQANLDEAFLKFAEQVPEKGRVFVNGDDPGVRRLQSSLPTTSVSFGINSGNDICVSALALYGNESRFTVQANGLHSGSVFLPVPGRHMVENALGCIAVCQSLGIDFQTISRALAGFKTASRRWNERGVFGGVRVIEDFAHHPVELRVNLDAARLSLKPGQRVVLVFQPQLFSRTARLSQAYASVIRGFDAAFLLEVDGAGENPVDAKGSEHIIGHLHDHDQHVYFHRKIHDMVDSLQAFVKSGDLVFLAGGMDIPVMTERLIHRLSHADTKPVALKALLARQRHECKRQTPPPANINSVALLEQNFHSFAASTAVSCGTDKLSYAELDFISSCLAQELGNRLATRRKVIALGLPPSIDQLACQVSVLRAGAAVVCLDENLPGKRLAYMLEVAGASLLITSKGSYIDKAIVDIDKLYLDDISTRPGLQQAEAGFLPAGSQTDCLAKPQASAFICFTSGSTGKPKGVPVSHAALTAFLPVAIERLQLSGESKTAQNTALSFDVSIGETMLTLSAGGELHIPAHGRPLLGRNLHEFINQNQITHLFGTPSVLATLPATSMDSLQVIISAGEVCSQSLANSLSQRAQLINAYGPAEATIYATAWNYRHDQAVCIGTPLAHVNVHVLDSNNQIARAGECGEICLAGVGVCNGYLGNAEINAGRFISIATRHGKSIRGYKTGDLGIIRADGQIEYIGRLDNQIKIRGNRVELEEIDAAMMRLDFVVDAVCCLDDSGQQPKIHAYYTTSGDSVVDDHEISEVLCKWLPDYMLPSAYIHVDEVSLTASGKKDRRETVRKNQFRQQKVTDFIPPVSDSQIRLASLWQKALGVDSRIGLKHEFRLAGGDSLQYMMLMMDIENEFSIDMPPGFLGQQVNLQAMAESIDELRAGVACIAVNTEFLDSSIYKQQKAFTADWSGRRHNATSLIVSCGKKHAEQQLFWCFQTGTEFKNLATSLGKDFCIHGMRSGHLVMDYSDENLSALSTYYAEQVSQINPEGPLYLGGNCQGGQVAHAVAQLLVKQGRDVQLLILMEAARLPAYAGRLAFIYGKDSYLNPYSRYDDGLSQIGMAYPQGFSMDIIPGGHGSYFTEPNILYLVSRIRSCIEHVSH